MRFDKEGLKLIFVLLQLSQVVVEEHSQSFKTKRDWFDQVKMSGKKCLFAPCSGKDGDFKISGSKGIATLLIKSKERGDTAIH